MKTITQEFFLRKGNKTLKAFLLSLLFAMGSQTSYGQLLTWLTEGNLGTETTEPSTYNDPNLSASNLSFGSGVTPAANASRFGGSSWGADVAAAITGNDWIQFTVTPKPGTSFTATSFAFIWDRSTTGPRHVNLYSSNDNYAQFGSVISMAPSTTTLRTISLTGVTAHTNITTAVTFRLIGYGSTNVVTGTGGFDCAAGRTTPNVTLNGTTTVIYTVWDGTAWSNGAPNSSIDAIIDGAYSTTDNGAISAKSLTVNASKTLTINRFANVTVAGALVNNGSIIVNNNANLIQTAATNTNSGSGTTTVNRTGSDIKRLDYTLWSSPVASQNLRNFSPLTFISRYYTFNESSNKFSVVASPATTTFTAGRSFLIRMPDVYPADSGFLTSYYLGNSSLAFPGVFTGTLNNGDIPVTLAKSEGINKGFQVVGNPYPSVIDAQTFVTANTANIEGTLYFWRKTNGAASSYATWTSGGSTTTTLTSGTPNGKIQVGQGFIVQAKNAGTVSNFFTNAMRDAAASSTQFFKVKQTAQKDRVWLNLTGANDVFSQALVAYIDDASAGLDQYDGKYINDSDIALTTSINNEEYTIQGRPAFDATDVVALNFKTNAAGTYTIAIDHVDGLFSKGQVIYLVDSKAGVTTNLNESAYTFTAEAGVDNTRFTLTYQKTLKVDAPLFNENSVLVSRTNGTLNVKSNAVAINNVKVFDVQGRLIAERKNVKSNTASFANLKANQVLIVKVTAENNSVVTKKVIN